MSMGIPDDSIINNEGFTTPPRYSDNSDEEQPETPRISRRNLRFLRNNYENIHNPINENLVINLEQSFINYIFHVPNQTFSRSLPNSANCEEDCPICLQSMSEGNIVCGTCDERHRFHVDCVRMVRERKCPMCRANW